MTDDLWRSLFADSQSAWHEGRQDKEIAQASEVADAALESTGRLEDENERLRAQVARQQLVLQTLLDWHLARGDFDAATFGVLVARADLADGVEDGALGPQRALEAPKCGDCGRPVNPSRTSCVFCGAKVTAAPVRRSPPPRLVSCRTCGDRVPESRTYFSGSGLVCDVCFL